MWVQSAASLSWLRIQSCCELRCRLSATALIQPLAWEPPYAAGAALKDRQEGRKEGRKEERKKEKERRKERKEGGKERSADPGRIRSHFIFMVTEILRMLSNWLRSAGSTQQSGKPCCLPLPTQDWNADSWLGPCSACAWVSAEMWVSSRARHSGLKDLALPQL